MQRDPREVIIRPVITEKKGYTRTWKKAMVTLAEGDTIEIFSA